MAQFLIMVRVPEVEPHVARLRARLDPSAKRGLGAHVTVLHWNMPADGLDPTALERIAAAVSVLAPFDYRITRLARFPGTLYLAAEPAAPFVLLRDRLAAALRMGEPGRGVQEPLIPHVSVVRKSVSDDREAEAELTTMLERCAPISCACRQIVLLENSTGSWRPVLEFVLNGDKDIPWRGPS
jgi:hypothetical protein